MFKPALEVLEDRAMPSGGFGIGNTGFFNSGHAAGQARAASPRETAADRATQIALVATNFLGIGTIPIAVKEAHGEQMRASAENVSGANWGGSASTGWSDPPG